MSTNINKQLLTAIENRYNDMANALNEKKFSVYENEMILPQSKILPPDGKTYNGKADIVKYMEEYFNSRGKFVSKVEEVNGDGDWAYSRGTYKFTEGNTDKEVGKMVTVWRKIDSVYKVYIDTWNITKSC